MAVPPVVLGPTDQEFGLVGAQRWAEAEEVTGGIIRQFQPNAKSEELRRGVMDFIQNLIRLNLGCEVIPYGSVPLKTFLPDGDIDLTAFGVGRTEDELVTKLKLVLEAEAKKKATSFVVKDVQLIHAEVKLVKCIVQNVVVDISFNQLGGLCTLCFLEQVDHVIGNDHLFKRSIILIKAWCFYESRVLGAYHGLISTYALEVLVLYIFNVFHSTLAGPLSVLFKFLDYFSKFNWENYCISLLGPVRISAVPDIAVETSQCGSNLLLSDEFLRHCSDTFSVPCKVLEKFPVKHLNIIDPLKKNNNLGRSVNKANFCRIRSAFAFGSKKLRQILMEPGYDMDEKLHKFFSNTCRNGSGQRPGFQVSIPRFSLDTDSVSTLAFESCQQEKFALGLESAKNIGSVSGINQNLYGSCHDGIEKISLSVTETESSEQTELQENGEENGSRAGAPYYAPHLYFSYSNSRDTETEEEKICEEQSEDNETEVGVLTSVAPIAKLNLSDLSGDRDYQFLCMQYGRWCYEYGLSECALPKPPPLPYYLNNMRFFESKQHLSQFKSNGFNHGLPPFYRMNGMFTRGLASGLEETAKRRGTGTYIPNMVRSPSGYQPLEVEGLKSGQPKSLLRFPVDEGAGNKKSLSPHLSNVPPRKLNPNANGFVPKTVRVPELSSAIHCMPVQPLVTSTQCFPASGIQTPNPLFSMNRVMVPSCHLRDEEAFPPLGI